MTLIQSTYDEAAKLKIHIFSKGRVGCQLRIPAPAPGSALSQYPYTLLITTKTGKCYPLYTDSMVEADEAARILEEFNNDQSPVRIIVRRR